MGDGGRAFASASFINVGNAWCFVQRHATFAIKNSMCKAGERQGTKLLKFSHQAPQWVPQECSCSHSKNACLKEQVCSHRALEHSSEHGARQQLR